jgi:hypothetical protein
MKILTIFVDMIRANRLSTFNNEIKVDTPLDVFFKQLGGTSYPNFYTPGPDTPRGISAFLTGVDPYKNGCNTRLKWPQYFLDKSLPTVFDIFIKNNYKINCFSSPTERNNGLFPEHISQMDIHNSDYDLNEYLSDIELKKDHFIFLSIPDYHWAFDDFGYSISGEKESYKIAKSVFDIVFKNLDKDDFDHIFIFSDHGFKFSFERKYEDKKMMLNTDRINNILFHRIKGQNDFLKNTKLSSLTDLYPTYEEILGIKAEDVSCLFSSFERDYVIIEDHINFLPMVNQNVELWAVVRIDIIYIRTLNEAITINKKNKIISKVVNRDNDELLKKESSFGIYLNEYEKIFRYKGNILSKSVYMNGKKRHSRKKVFKYLNFILDLLRFKANRWKIKLN